MKKLELMKKLEEFNKFGDLIIDDFNNNKIYVTIDDFEGFNEDWEEVYREVKIEEDDFIKFLQNNSQSYEMDFYSIFNFEDCFVELGYSSYDI